MPVGTSGRIVIEINPDLKQELYERLHQKDLNLKQWFLSHVDEFLQGKEQLSLNLGDFSPNNITEKMEEKVK